MLSDRLTSLSTALQAYEEGQPIPAGMAQALRREIAAAVEDARAMESAPIPLNQRLTERHLGGSVALFPIVPRDNGGAA